MKSKLHIALGSNVGDQEATVIKTLKRIDSLPETDILAVSDLYLSDPVGENLNGAFINAAICVETSIELEAFHSKLTEIERDLGKNKTEGNQDRTIDIDIIFADELVGKFGGLDLPHPRYMDRMFVLMPLMDIKETLNEENIENIKIALERIASDSGPLCLQFKSVIY